MSYTVPGGTRLDLSSAGRGLHQTLLLLAYLYANPQTVMLLDEADLTWKCFVNDRSTSS